jgi:hypothetical protein
MNNFISSFIFCFLSIFINFERSLFNRHIRRRDSFNLERFFNFLCRRAYSFFQLVIWLPWNLHVFIHSFYNNRFFFILSLRNYFLLNSINHQRIRLILLFFIFKFLGLRIDLQTWLLLFFLLFDLN